MTKKNCRWWPRLPGSAAVIAGLLKYCELDTMAMVFLWEGFKHI